jgi:nicotinamidase-related amidase
MKKILQTLFILLSFSTLLSAQDKPKEPIKPALIVIDIQNQFLPMMDQEGKDFTFFVINAYIDGFRSAGLPVVRIYHSDPKWGPTPGTPEFEFPEEIHIKPEDPKVIKTYGDAFNKTDLEKVLRDMEVNTVFLCGLSATGCVISTYIGAKNHDFKTFLIKDGMLSHKKEYTEQIEIIFEAVGYEVVEVMLENAGE